MAGEAASSSSRHPGESLSVDGHQHGLPHPWRNKLSEFADELRVHVAVLGVLCRQGVGKRERAGTMWMAQADTNAMGCKGESATCCRKE